MADTWEIDFKDKTDLNQVTKNKIIILLLFNGGR